jgi:hypothetical protein
MPPIDSRQILFETTAADHIITLCIALCIVWVACNITRGKIFLFCLAATIACTTPLLAVSSDAIWGAFPTIDKEGSLLFYRDGVHLRLFQFSDPAHRLIGFHMGHLWIAQFLDLFTSDIGAFNLQGLLNIALTWYCTTLLLCEMGAKKIWAWLLASQLALHLHLFRDINFYTIEKSAIYPLSFFWYCTLRTAKGWKYGPIMMGLSFFISSWINLYWGIFETLLTPCIFLIHRKDGHQRRLIKGVISCFIFGLCIAVYQQLLTTSGPPFAHTEQFSQRAALDRFSIWPLSWNRLSWYTSLTPLLFIGIVGGITQKKLETKYLGITLFFFLLSLGPNIFENTQNPIYLALSKVPSLWRFAKPEAFFFISFIGLLSSLIHIKPNRMVLTIIGILISIQWFSITRTQEEYPQYLSTPIETALPKNWERRIFTPLQKEKPTSQ